MKYLHEVFPPLQEGVVPYLDSSMDKPAYYSDNLPFGLGLLLAPLVGWRASPREAIGLARSGNGGLAAYRLKFDDKGKDGEGRVNTLTFTNLPVSCFLNEHARCKWGQAGLDEPVLEEVTERVKAACQTLQGSFEEAIAGFAELREEEKEEKEGTEEKKKDPFYSPLVIGTIPPDKVIHKLETEAYAKEWHSAQAWLGIGVQLSTEVLVSGHGQEVKRPTYKVAGMFTPDWPWSMPELTDWGTLQSNHRPADEVDNLLRIPRYKVQHSLGLVPPRTRIPVNLEEDLDSHSNTRHSFSIMASKESHLLRSLAGWLALQTFRAATPSRRLLATSAGTDAYSGVSMLSEYANGGLKMTNLRIDSGRTLETAMGLASIGSQEMTEMRYNRFLLVPGVDRVKLLERMSAVRLSSALGG